MKRINETLLLLAVSVSVVQGQQIRSATWGTDQFFLRYRTMLEPARPKGQEIHIGGGGVDDSVTNHRILTDSDRKKFFGYDLQVAVLGGGRFQLNFKPLTVPALEHKLMGLDGWDEILLPSVPASMQLNDGETVALDLLVNPSTGEKIVEYITVGASARAKSATVGGGARDLQASDVQMSLMSPKLQLNGKNWEWNRGDSHGAANGAILWLYVPERGRFLVSPVRHDELGFRQAGEAKGSQMKFIWNGETYEFQTAGRILPTDAACNLYVYLEQGYQAPYPPSLYGGADRPDSLIHR